LVSDSVLRIFLVHAKRHTYAAGDNDAEVTPVLSGSRQLEYREGDLLYRDIYFGEAYFVGQETVYEGPAPVWAMAYAGGPLPDSPLAVADLYEFLRAVLRRVPEDRPYRGPHDWTEGSLTYSNRTQGDVWRFRGTETITQKEKVFYRLEYGGGLLR